MKGWGVSDRVEAIQKMLAKAPNDLFLHYALGKEHAAAGRCRDACAEFDRCIELDAGYLPAYVEAGKCLRASGDLAAARAVFLRALQVAADQGQRHVRDYVQQQLQGLPG